MEGKSSDWLRGPSGPTVCRCCFAEGCYKDISTEYFWMGKREVYAEMLTETLDLTIAYAQSSGPNSNSRLICEPCISRLRDASEFKRQVQECEKMFLQYLDPGREGVTDLEAIPETLTLEKDVKLENVKQEKGQSDDDFDDRAAFEDDDDDDLDDQPLTRLASKVPKKESVDLLDLLDNAKVAEKRKSTAKTRATPAKKAKTKKESPKATASKTKPEKKKKGIESKNKEISKKNASIVLRHSSAYPFQQTSNILRCCFCLDVYEKPQEFREHVDSQHPDFDKSELPSIESENLVRVDITNLHCTVCSTAFVKLDDLAAHLVEHDLEIDTTQPIGLVPYKLDSNACVVCDKVFPGFFQLSRHTVTHFCNFVCEACGWTFETQSGLRYHEKFSHLASKFTCRVCLKAFSSKDERKKHVHENPACMPAKCYICKERFPSWDRKEQHLIEMHGKPKKSYPCTQCDKVFQQNSQLYFHFKATHTDDLECQYCQKRFSARSNLNEHLAMHEGKHDLVCSVCDLKFRYYRGLRNHMKLHDGLSFPCTACDHMYTTQKGLDKHKYVLGSSRDAAKLNAQIILRHSTAYPFQQSSNSLRCCFCPAVFNDPALFRAHMDVIHMGVDRSTCNKSNLDTQTRVDVTNLRCIKCIKRFASIEAVAKHLHDEHELDIKLSQSLGLVLRS